MHIYPQHPPNEMVYTVTQLNQTVRLVLEQTASHILLVGEISNFSAPSSGHWYFTLKDNTAQIKAAMFRSTNRTVKFLPQNGMQVMVRASVTLYEPRGDYQIIIEKMKPAGDGQLQQAFEALKNKLAQEGLFAVEFKQTLPLPARCIGVITSPTGAAIQDILHILKRRDPGLPVIIYPSQVQGQNAAQTLIQMIEIANLRKECDVLILARGGGSLEDLWCFNDEALARAIFASQIPIISAVGHETDVTISDFVADVRAPTPSAAAELVSRNQLELLEKCQRLAQRLEFSLDYYLSQKMHHYTQIAQRLNLQHPQLQLTRKMLKLNEIINRIGILQYRQIEQDRLTLARLQQKLSAHTPYITKTEQLNILIRRLIQCNPVHHFKGLEIQLASKISVMTGLITELIKSHQQTVHLFARQLYQHGPRSHVHAHLQFLISLNLRANQSIRVKLEAVKLEAKGKYKQLDALSPLKNLDRGFTIASTSKNERLKSQTQVNIGDVIETRVSDGLIVSEVIKISPIVLN